MKLSRLRLTLRVARRYSSGRSSRPQPQGALLTKYPSSSVPAAAADVAAHSSPTRQSQHALAPLLKQLQIREPILTGLLAIESPQLCTQIEGLVALFREFGFHERKFSSLFAYNSSQVLWYSASDLRPLLSAVRDICSSKAPLVASIVSDVSSLMLLKQKFAADPCGQARSVAAVLSSEYGAERASQLLARQTYLLLFDADYLADNIAQLKALFHASQQDALASQVLSYPSVLRTKASARAGAFKFFEQHVCDGDTETAQNLLLRSLRPLCADEVALRKSFDVVAEVCGGARGAKFAVHKHPRVLLTIKKEKLDLLRGMGFDPRKFIKRSILDAPEDTLKHTFEWLCDKFGRPVALNCHDLLASSVTKNLEPTLNSLLDLGLTVEDVSYTPRLLLLSDTLRIRPLDEIMKFHELDVSSREVLGLLKGLKASELSAMKRRVDLARLMLRRDDPRGDVTQDAALVKDREHLLEMARRASLGSKKSASVRMPAASPVSKPALANVTKDDKASPVKREKESVPTSPTVLADAALPCTVCDKQFFHAELLRKHRAKHLFSYQCEMCARRFRRKSTLRAHRLRHGAKQIARDVSDPPKDVNSTTRTAQSDLVIPVSTKDMLGSSRMFSRPQPILEQSLQHACTLAAKASVERENFIRSGPGSGSFLDFALLRDDAPQAAFFAISPSTHANAPPQAQTEGGAGHPQGGAAIVPLYGGSSEHSISPSTNANTPQAQIESEQIQGGGGDAEQHQGVGSDSEQLQGGVSAVVPLSMYPQSCEPGERCARALLSFDSVWSSCSSSNNNNRSSSSNNSSSSSNNNNRSSSNNSISNSKGQNQSRQANDPDPDRDREWRAYLAGCSAVRAPGYVATARALVLLARSERDIAWAEKWCTRLPERGPDDDSESQSECSLISRNEATGLWEVATVVSHTPDEETGVRVDRPLQLSVAVCGGVALTRDHRVRWRECARIRQEDGVVRCPFCAKASKTYSSCHEHVRRAHKQLLAV